MTPSNILLSIDKLNISPDGIQFAMVLINDHLNYAACCEFHAAKNIADIMSRSPEFKKVMIEALAMCNVNAVFKAIDEENGEGSADHLLKASGFNPTDN